MVQYHANHALGELDKVQYHADHAFEKSLHTMPLGDMVQYLLHAILLLHFHPTWSNIMQAMPLGT